MVKRVKSARLWLASATVALASASGACVVVFGMDPLSEKPAVDGGSLDGGSLDAKTTDASEADDAGVCDEDDIGEVGKPAVNSPSQGDGGAAFFAVTRLDLGIDPNADPPGLNLDRRVTADPATSGCFTSDGGKLVSDPDGGVDNAMFGLLQELSTLYAAFKPETINQRLARSYFGFVFRVDEWNRGPDDDSVRVSVFPTIGYWTTTPQGAHVWDGRDPRVPFDADAGHVWMPDERFKVGTIGSSLRSREAWISGGRLVARFDRFTLPLRSSVDELRSFDIELHDAWLTASISPDGAALSEGLLGGRVRTEAFIRQVALLYNQELSSHLCSAVAFGIGTFCSARDVRASHCDDGKGIACDALSFGAGFEAQHVDGLGPFRSRTDDEYRDAGQVPPWERCPDLDGGRPIDCKP